MDQCFCYNLKEKIWWYDIFLNLELKNWDIL